MFKFHNCRLEISRAPTKAKSAYSPAYKPAYYKLISLYHKLIIITSLL